MRQRSQGFVRVMLRRRGIVHQVVGVCATVSPAMRVHATLSSFESDGTRLVIK